MKTLIIQPLLWASPLLIVLLVSELVYSRLKGHKSIYQWKDLLASSLMGVGAMMAFIPLWFL